MRLTKKYVERIYGVDLVGRDVGEMPADAALFAALWRAATREGRLRLFKTTQAAFERSDAAAVRSAGVPAGSYTVAAAEVGTRGRSTVKTQPLPGRLRA